MQYIKPIKPIQPTQPIAKIPTVETVNQINKIGTIKSIAPTQTFLANYNDPTELNSYIDALTNKAAVSKEFGEDWAKFSTGTGTASVITGAAALIAYAISPFLGPAAPVAIAVGKGLAITSAVLAIPSIPAAGKVTYERTIQPIAKGKPTEAFLNTLMNVGETMDYSANPIKGLILEGSEGFIKGTGLSDAGRVNYDYDTGNVLLDIGAEILSDPIGLIQLGTSIGQAALTTKIAKNVVEPITKELVKQIAETTGKNMDNYIKPITKKVAKNVKIHIYDIAENAKYIYKNTPEAQVYISKKIGDVQLTLRKSFKDALLKTDKSLTAETLDEILNIAAKSGPNALIQDNLLINLTRNIKLDDLTTSTIQSLALFNKATDAFEAHLVKGAIFSSGIAFGLDTIKHSHAIKKFTNNFIFRHLKKANLMRYDRFDLTNYDSVKSVYLSTNKYAFDYLGTISPNVEATFFKYIGKQLDRDIQVIRETIANSTPTTVFYNLSEKFINLYNITFQEYVALINEINIKEKGIFQNHINIINTQFYTEITKAVQGAYKRANKSKLAKISTVVNSTDPEKYQVQLNKNAAKVVQKLNTLHTGVITSNDLDSIGEKLYVLKYNKEYIVEMFITNSGVRKNVKTLTDPNTGIINLTNEIHTDMNSISPEANAMLYSAAKNVTDSLKQYTIIQELFDNIDNILLPDTIKNASKFKRYIKDAIMSNYATVSTLIANFKKSALPNIFNTINSLMGKDFNILDYPEVCLIIENIYKTYLNQLNAQALTNPTALFLTGFTDNLKIIVEHFKGIIPKQTLNAAIELEKTVSTTLIAIKRVNSYLFKNTIFSAQDIFEKFALTTAQLTDMGLVLHTVADITTLKQFFNIPLNVHLDSTMFKKMYQLSSFLQETSKAFEAQSAKHNTAPTYIAILRKILFGDPDHPERIGIITRIRAQVDKQTEDILNNTYYYKKIPKKHKSPETALYHTVRLTVPNSEFMYLKKKLSDAEVMALLSYMLTQNNSLADAMMVKNILFSPGKYASAAHLENYYGDVAQLYYNLLHPKNITVAGQFAWETFGPKHAVEAYHFKDDIADPIMYLATFNKQMEQQTATLQEILAELEQNKQSRPLQAMLRRYISVLEKYDTFFKNYQGALESKFNLDIATKKIEQIFNILVNFETEEALINTLKDIVDDVDGTLKDIIYYRNTSIKKDLAKTANEVRTAIKKLQAYWTGSVTFKQPPPQIAKDFQECYWEFEHIKQMLNSAPKPTTELKEKYNIIKKKYDTFIKKGCVDEFFLFWRELETVQLKLQSLVDTYNATLYRRIYLEHMQEYDKEILKSKLIPFNKEDVKILYEEKYKRPFNKEELQARQKTFDFTQFKESFKEYSTKKRTDLVGRLNDINKTNYPSEISKRNAIASTQQRHSHPNDRDKTVIQYEQKQKYTNSLQKKLYKETEASKAHIAELARKKTVCVKKLNTIEFIDSEWLINKLDTTDPTKYLIFIKNIENTVISLKKKYKELSEAFLTKILKALEGCKLNTFHACRKAKDLKKFLKETFNIDVQDEYVPKVKEMLNTLVIRHYTLDSYKNFKKSIYTSALKYYNANKELKFLYTDLDSVDIRLQYQSFIKNYGAQAFEAGLLQKDKYDRYIPTINKGISVSMTPQFQEKGIMGVARNTPLEVIEEELKKIPTDVLYKLEQANKIKPDKNASVSQLYERKTREQFTADATQYFEQNIATGNENLDKYLKFASELLYLQEHITDVSEEDALYILATYINNIHKHSADIKKTTAEINKLKIEYTTNTVDAMKTSLNKAEAKALVHYNISLNEQQQAQRKAFFKNAQLVDVFNTLVLHNKKYGNRAMRAKTVEKLQNMRFIKELYANILDKKLKYVHVSNTDLKKYKRCVQAYLIKKNENDPKSIYNAFALVLNSSQITVDAVRPNPVLGAKTYTPGFLSEKQFEEYMWHTLEQIQPGLKNGDATNKANRHIFIFGTNAQDSANRYAQRFAKKYSTFVTYVPSKIDWKKHQKLAEIKALQEAYENAAGYLNRGCLNFWDRASTNGAVAFKYSKHYNTPIIDIDIRPVLNPDNVRVARKVYDDLKAEYVQGLDIERKKQKDANKAIADQYFKELSESNRIQWQKAYEEYKQILEQENDEIVRNYFKTLMESNAALKKEYQEQKLENVKITPWEPVKEQQKIMREVNNITYRDITQTVYNLITCSPEQFVKEIAYRKGVLIIDRDCVSKEMQPLLEYLVSKLDTNKVAYCAMSNMYVFTLQRSQKLQSQNGMLYLNGEALLRPKVVREFNTDALNKILKDDNVNISDILQSFIDDVYTLTGVDIGTSQGELLTKEIFINFVKSNSLLPEDIINFINNIDDTLFETICFNESIIGTPHFKQSMGLITGGDILKNMSICLTQIKGYLRPSMEWLYTMFDESMSISAKTGLFARFTDEELLLALREAPNYRLVFLAETRKGVRLQEVVPVTVKDIAEARKANAVIMPLQTYKQAYKYINLRIGSTGFAKIWERILYIYKFTYLLRPGAFIRNFIDTNTKSLLEMGVSDYKENREQSKIILKDIAQMKKDLTDIHKRATLIYNDVQEMYDKIQARAWDGLIHTRDVKAWFDNGLAKSGLTYAEYKELCEEFLDTDLAGGVTRYLNDIDAKDTWKSFVNITSKIIEMGNKTENVNRLAMYLYAKNKNMSYTDAMTLISKIHFDYSFKTKTEQLVDFLFPFSTFSMRNLNYWAEMLEKHPWILRNYVHIMKPSWDFSDYTPEQLANNRRAQTQIKYGQLKLAEFNNKVLLFKLNPSIQDALQMFSDPINNIYERLAAPISAPIQAIQQQSAAPLSNLLPVISPYIQSAQQFDKYGNISTSVFNLTKSFNPASWRNKNYTNINSFRDGQRTQAWQQSQYRRPTYTNNIVYDGYRAKGIAQLKSKYYPVLDVAHDVKMRYTIDVYNRIKNRVKTDVYKGVRYRIKINANRFR